MRAALGLIEFCNTIIISYVSLTGKRAVYVQKTKTETGLHEFTEINVFFYHDEKTVVHEFKFIMYEFKLYVASECL